MIALIEAAVGSKAQFNFMPMYPAMSPRPAPIPTTSKPRSAFARPRRWPKACAATCSGIAPITAFEGPWRDSRR